MYPPRNNSKTRSCVIEVTPDVRLSLMSAGRVNIKRVRCRLSDHITVLQCFKCYKFGHVAKKCENKGCYAKCSGEHLTNTCVSKGPNPFQIRWSGYACHRSFWDKSIHVLLQKLFDTYFFIFLFYQNFMRSAIPKIPRKFLLRKKFFQCNFQTATVSPVFYAFKRVTHNFTQFWALFHLNARIMHFLLKNALFRKMHISRKPHFFAQFSHAVIEDLNTYLDVFVRFRTK